MNAHEASRWYQLNREIYRRDPRPETGREANWVWRDLRTIIVPYVALYALRREVDNILEQDADARRVQLVKLAMSMPDYRQHSRANGLPKRQYTEQEATRIADGRRMRAYRCRVCGWWHVGNRAKRLNPQRRARLRAKAHA